MIRLSITYFLIFFLCLLPASFLMKYHISRTRMKIKVDLNLDDQSNKNETASLGTFKFSLKTLSLRMLKNGEVIINSARFLKYIWQFSNMNEWVKITNSGQLPRSTSFLSSISSEKRVLPVEEYQVKRNTTVPSIISIRIH